MSLEIIKQQKIDARRSIARCEKIMGKLQPNDRYIVMKIMSIERDFLKYKSNSFNKVADIIQARHNRIMSVVGTDIIRFAEVLPSVPGAPNKYVSPYNIPTFGKLIKILERKLENEGNSIVADPNPSANDIKRWALRSAVLEYYKGLNINPEVNVADTVGSNLTIDELAPNKKQIYNIWIQKLDAQTKSDDKYKLSMEEYNEALERGIPQGGAFEKLLDRYREDFMTDLWKQYYQEENNGSN